MLDSLGLGGDGDEVEAIADVEREFGIRLNVADAPSWHTVGDIYVSLQNALPPECFEHPDTWARFSNVICYQTGADASLVGKETRLLGPGLAEVVRRFF